MFAVLTKSNVVQAALRDKLLQDHSVLAAFLTGLRMYLEDPTKVTKLTAAFSLVVLLLKRQSAFPINEALEEVPVHTT